MGAKKKKRKLKRRKSSVSLIETVAEEIKEFYIARYRNRDKLLRGFSNYTPGEKWDYVWPKAAKLCLEKHVQPRMVINFLFDNYLGTVRQPLAPNMLVSAKFFNTFLENYWEMLETQKIGIESDFASDLDKLQTKLIFARHAIKEGHSELNEDEAKKFIFLDNSTEIGPLIRYCFAKKEGMESVSRNLFVPAVHQYLVNPDIHDKVYGDLLPARFKERAREVYRMALQ